MTELAAREVAHQSTVGRALVVLLALLTALDAMAIDMYLPGMPMIAQTYGVSAGSVQQTFSWPGWHWGSACMARCWIVLVVGCRSWQGSWSLWQGL